MSPESDPDLQRLVRQSARRSFGPGFADRVLRRVAAEHGGFEALLLREFRWLAAAATLAAVLLGGYATLQAGDGQSLLDAALGLEPLTAESAFSPEALLAEMAASDEGLS